MSKNILFPLISLLLFLLPKTVYSQISEGGIPTSFIYTNTLKSDLPTVQIPIDFSVEDLKTVDAWQVSQGAPLKVGKFIDTNLTINNSGNWTTLSNGTKIWQLRIQAKNAIAIMLSFKEFYIPENGKLFIYNIDKTHIIGAYTHQTNPSTKEYATEFISGDDIILEYETDEETDEQPRIAIDAIGYGYNHLSISQTKANIGPDTSGSCMVNINCEEGDAWQAEKKGVCLITFTINKSIYYCSGSVVNNTAEDLKPYILSANHCVDIDSTTVTQEDFNKVVFYFHFERTGCDKTSSVASYKTMVGCKKIVGIPLDGGSDGLLLLLNNNIPEKYDVYYNGWDRSNTPATSGVGIHHPSGDYKKISTFKKTATAITWYGADSIMGAKKAHWNVIFSSTSNGHGVTEGGSSGSPLFNQNKLIVGTLSGGSSTCKEPTLSNIYGKLYCHWDQYSKLDSTTRMDIYLDPTGSGVTQLDGRYATPRKEAPTNLILTYKNQEVQLSWTAPVSKDEKPEKYAIYRNNIFIGYATETSFADSEPEIGTQLYGVSALYADEKESTTVNESIYVYELKAPTDVTAKMDNNSVILNWKAPVHQQMIYWGTGTAAHYHIGFGTSFYFGQRWESIDLLPLHLNLIRSVFFIPTEGSTYSLFIKQGNRTYTQELKNLSYNEINEIALDTPFTIDASQELIIAFHAPFNGKETYPAVIDEGPAINEKGNLISVDGKVWEYFYEPSDNEEENYDFNFLIAATVSSEEGELTETKSLTVKAPLLLTKSTALIKKTKAAEENENSSIRSIQAAAFPEITGYNIYRNEALIENITNKSVTEYIDKQASIANTSYKVSALYGDNESPKSEATVETNVNNESISLSEITISPVLFNNQVQLIGSERVHLLEIISADGKLVFRQDHPKAIIYTNAYPAGIYLFRLHTDKGIKVIKGVKK